MLGASSSGLRIRYQATSTVTNMSAAALLLLVLTACAAQAADSVLCPDQSRCQDGATCCLLQSGRYGCCPYTLAQCCSDHLHCCPEGFRCVVSNGTCIRDSDARGPDQLALTRLQETGDNGYAQPVRCRDGTSCREGSTCCRIKAGGFGCCAFEDAVCCPDRESCCPNGYECASNGTCRQGSTTVPMAKKYPSVKFPVSASASAVYCPDASVCDDGTTCCPISDTQYGCCPFDNAVCCSDDVHCCPFGYQCHLSDLRCIRQKMWVPMAKKLPAWRTLAKTDEAIRCPDQSYCPNSTTCCLLSAGHYGCCPLPNAVCCSDHEHCCPEGTRCQVSTGACIKDIEAVRLTDTSPNFMAASALKAIQCPDHSYCPNSTTCCLMSAGHYGCCPFPNAVCCSDLEHCCPEGTRCQVSTGACIKDTEAVRLTDTSPNFMAASALSDVNEVLCSDKTRCQDGQTCCSNKQGGYSCCPYDNAVCCSDKETCCPQDYVCDAPTGLCLFGTDSEPMAKKLPALLLADVVNATASSWKGEFVRCPDQTYCSDGSTCCLLSTGQYGCCPFVHAVCCSDHEHCCPKGTRCQVSTGSCVKGSDAAPVTRSQPDVDQLVAATSHNVTNDVVCPDKKHCSDGSTCCQDKQGGYGCCPFPNAVCCSDKETCCPQGFVCHVSTGTCTLAADVVPMAKKLPAFYPDEVAVNSEFTQCPDGSRCPGATTCCLMSSGRYGCCPFPYAECCSDHEHCCPEGYRCQGSGFCAKGSTTVAGTKTFPTMDARGFSALSMRPTHPVKNAADDVVCPDGKHCSASETCCSAASGGYGCCPLVAAVCCSDGKHCCPAGTSCSIRDNKCYPPGILCPDMSTCPFGTSCCPMSGARFGCCPYPLATCCLDLVHCCPAGTICLPPLEICILSSGTVTNATLLLSSTEMKARRLLAGYVNCPDRSYCPNGSTCCLSSGGGYGCCPFPYAECCSDHVHCCPEGFRCQMSTGSCVQGSKDASMKRISQSLRTQLQEPSVGTGENGRCPDGSYCPSASTCCISSSGRYACCPYSYAECCSDHVHCCPEGYRCQISTGSCVRGSKTAAMKKMYQSLSASTQQLSVKDGNGRCPDGSYCPSGSTCCISSSGRYACCPYSYAQCCSDHVHCCPEGYRCQISTGSCVRGSKSTYMKQTYPSSRAPIQQPARGQPVWCPGNVTYCPEGSTCCSLPSGDYGCCPHARAQCCDDHQHCCAEGYTCEPGVGCTREVSTLARGKKYPAVAALIFEALFSSSVVCPDKASCPPGSTCCKLYSGGYGCCPYAAAVCCTDGIHCCPNGYRCSLLDSSCEREEGGDVVPMLKKFPSTPAP